jgi:hypothetical protein
VSWSSIFSYHSLIASANVNAPSLPPPVTLTTFQDRECCRRSVNIVGVWLAE